MGFDLGQCQQRFLLGDQPTSHNTSDNIKIGNSRETSTKDLQLVLTMASIQSTRRRKVRPPFWLLCIVLTWSLEILVVTTNAFQILGNVPWNHNRYRGFTSNQDRKILHLEWRNTYWTRQNVKSTDGGDDNENAQPRQPGMADAFRQLESLKSLDDPEEYIPAPEKINVDAVLADSSTLLSLTAATVSTVSPEQDFAVYKNMMQEIEEEESAVSYAEVLDELGGSALQTDDTYSQIISELGGTKMKSSSPSSSSSSSSFSSWTKKSVPEEVVDVVNSTSEGGVSLSNEQLLDDALKEALNEVQLNNPQLNERSILNDKEMMKEIEDIFDRGNAQLIEGLDEIRREQVRSIFCMYR